MKSKTIIDIISVLFFLLFIDVGLSKLLDNHSFQVQLGQSPIVMNYVNLIAIPIPLLEVIVGIGILIPFTRKIALVTALGLMFTFTAYNIYLLTYGGHIPCGCGGIFKKMDWKAHLVVNSCMTILGVIAVCLSFKPSTTNSDEIKKYNSSLT